jgi:hypothetical protein
MIGEFLREAAVLTVVFIPLDRMAADRPLTVGWVLTILGVSGSLLAGGIITERRRD